LILPYLIGAFPNAAILLTAVEMLGTHEKSLPPEWQRRGTEGLVLSLRRWRPGQDPGFPIGWEAFEFIMRGALD
jgi:hypothetical protein